MELFIKGLWRRDWSSSSRSDGDAIGSLRRAVPKQRCSNAHVQNDGKPAEEEASVDLVSIGIGVQHAGKHHVEDTRCESTPSRNDLQNKAICRQESRGRLKVFVAVENAQSSKQRGKKCENG
jgi:hypothetical protein